MKNSFTRTARLIAIVAAVVIAAAGWFSPLKASTAEKTVRVFLNGQQLSFISDPVPEPAGIPASGFRLSAAQTANSKLTVQANVKTTLKTALLRMKNSANGQTRDVILTIADGQLSKPVYLSLGAGSYTIDVYASASAYKGQALYDFYFQQSLKATNTDVRDSYLVPSERVESDAPEIVKLAGDLTRGLPTDIAKSRAIHDWVASHIAYDTATYLAGKDRSDSALETLRGRLADCDGYSRLTAALHRAAGVPARMVFGVGATPASGVTLSSLKGSAPNHAWNEVKLGGSWLTQDTTWDAGYIDGATHRFVTQLSGKFFNPSASLFAMDHRKIAIAPE